MKSQDSNSTLSVYLVMLMLIMTTYACHSQHSINSINFYGETVNKESYLQNFLTVEVGEMATLETLESNRMNLVQLPKYGHVHLRIDTIPEQKIDVTYELYEVKTAYPIVNLGAIEGNTFYQLGIGNTSSLGVGLMYSAFYRNTDNRHNFQLATFKPFLLGKPIGIGFVFGRDATVEPVYFDEGTADFYYTKLNGGVDLKYYFTPRKILSLHSAYFEEDYELKQSEVVNFENFIHRKSLYSLEFRHDMRNYFYYYIEGNMLEAKALQVINYDFDADFKLAQVSYKGFLRLKERHNLGMRTQAGIATNSNSPFAPFVLDSYLNIRGSGNRQERGTGSFICNLEWRYAFFEKENLAAQAVLFTDFGSWRLPGEKLSIQMFKDEFRAFSGGGLRFIHKNFRNAILRLDYGIDISSPSQSGFVLGLGQYF